MSGRDTTNKAGDPIGGLYVVDSARPLDVGRLAAFAVRDHRGDRPDLIALMVAPNAPARAKVMTVLALDKPPGMLCPLASGVALGPDGRQAMFIVGQAPPGPSLAQQRRTWYEPDLINLILRPVAEALEALNVRGLTHRAIRLDNLFLPADNAPVVLGPFWAEPPASLQPVIYEPPYVGMCPPAGRGDGSIADDVHSLAVVLLWLALGNAPLAGLDDIAILRHKIELGGFAAMVGNARLPSMLTDLLRSMLAEDPEHRPPPSLLADPARARARRVAARPARRAQNTIEVGGIGALDLRTLGFAIARDHEAGDRLLRDGTIVHWLRRSLGDASTATKLDELMRQRTGSGDDRAAGDATLTMRAIVLFDPLAPMCWRGLALWPDALGPLIAAADGEREATLLEEIIAAEATLQWVTMRGKDDIGLARQDARQNRTLLKQPGWSGGLPRLRYVLNPLLPCASRLLDGALATRLPDLLAALESCSAAERDGQRPIDAEIGAMIAARHEDTVDTEILAITHGKDARVAIMAMLRLFSEMQARFAPDVRLPRLAAWLAREAAPLVESWRNPERRARLAKTLATVSEHGSLPSLLALLDNDDARAADERAAAAAANAVRAIDTELRQIAEQSAQRAILAKHLGTEFASAIAAVALVVVFFTLVLF